MDTMPATLALASRWETHPDHRGEYTIDDLAIIDLSAPVTAVTPLAVETARTPTVGEPISIVGDGRTGPGCSVSPQGQLTGATHLWRVSTFPAGGGVLSFNDTNVVACSGDSGGPALDRFNKIVGVASTGDSSPYDYHSTHGVGAWLSGALGTRIGMWDLRDHHAPSPRAYADRDPDGIMQGWTDANDVQLVGDFRGAGYDQLLMINRGAGAGRVFIADYRDGFGTTEADYLESYGQSGLLDGWHDQTTKFTVGDEILAGDFTHTGHKQVMFLNRSGTGGRVLIADFSAGGPPAQVQYWENYGDSGLLNDWMDPSDKVLAGDFMGRGYDQVMFLNRGPAGAGRVLIADFSDGHAPAEQLYREDYGTSTMLADWMDADDRIAVGDFMHRGHDQVLFINGDASPGIGRALIADFSDGVAPAEALYRENKNTNPLLDGWIDPATGQWPADELVVGDFIGAGYDQALFVDHAFADGKLLQLVDYHGGTATSLMRQVESVDYSAPDTLVAGSAFLRAGDFRGRGDAQFLAVAPR
jgi:hypothetical protein